MYLVSLIHNKFSHQTNILSPAYNLLQGAHKLVIYKSKFTQSKRLDGNSVQLGTGNRSKEAMEAVIKMPVNKTQPTQENLSTISHHRNYIHIF